MLTECIGALLHLGMTADEPGHNTIWRVELRLAIWRQKMYRRQHALAMKGKPALCLDHEYTPLVYRHDQDFVLGAIKAVAII
jgi:hypothetical protein